MVCIWSHQKYDYANYDQFAPNFDIAYKTIPCIFMPNLNENRVVGQKSWRIFYYVIWGNGWWAFFRLPTWLLRYILLVPRINNHLSSFDLGFVNIFSRQNVLCSLSLILFLLQPYKYGAKKCPKNHIRFDFWDDSSLVNQKTGKTTEKPLKELLWNQQICMEIFRNFEQP